MVNLSPPTYSAALQQLFESGTLATFVMYLLSRFKPFIEQIPFAAPGSKLHDATLDLSNWLLNLVALLLTWVALGQWHGPSDLFWVIFFGTLQASGANHTYSTVTRMGQSVGDSALSALQRSIQGSPVLASLAAQGGLLPGGPAVGGDTRNPLVDPFASQATSQTISQVASQGDAAPLSGDTGAGEPDTIGQGGQETEEPVEGQDDAAASSIASSIAPAGTSASIASTTASLSSSGS
jgi:hypothetical protein